MCKDIVSQAATRNFLWGKVTDEKEAEQSTTPVRVKICRIEESNMEKNEKKTAKIPKKKRGLEIDPN